MESSVCLPIRYQSPNRQRTHDQLLVDTVLRQPAVAADRTQVKNQLAASIEAKVGMSPMPSATEARRLLWPVRRP